MYLYYHPLHQNGWLLNWTSLWNCPQYKAHNEDYSLKARRPGVYSLPTDKLRDSIPSVLFLSFFHSDWLILIFMYQKTIVQSSFFSWPTVCAHKDCQKSAMLQKISTLTPYKEVSLVCKIDNAWWIAIVCLLSPCFNDMMQCMRDMLHIL